MADDMALLLKINGDATQAQATIKGVSDSMQAMARSAQSAERTVAEGLKAQGTSVKEVQQIYRQLGFSAEKSARDIAVAFGQDEFAAKALGSTVSRAGGTMSNAFLKSYGATQLLGRDLGTYIPFSVARLMSQLGGLQSVMSAAFGASLVIFAGEQILGLVPKIEKAADAISGWGAAAQKAFSVAIKDSDEALVKWGGLTTATKIATGYMLIHQTEAQINADLVARSLEKEVSGWRGVAHEIEGMTQAITGNVSELVVYVGEKAAVWKLNADSMQQYNVWQQQISNMGKLQKELQQEEKRTAHAADESAQKQERAAQAAARAVAHAQAQESAFLRSSDAELQRLIRHIDEVNRKLPASQMPKPLKGADARSLTAMPGNVAVQSQNPLEDAISQATPKISMQNQALLTLQQSLAGTKTAQQSLSAEMERMGAATIKAGVAATVYGQSAGKAMEQATKAVLASIAEQAAVQAVFSLATYFIDMATFQYAAAAQALVAAEMFGVVGAVAGAASAAIPGGSARTKGRSEYSSGAGRSQGASSGGGSGGGSGSGGGQQLAPGGNMPAAPKNGNLTIAVMGTQDAGQWLANTLNVATQLGAAGLSATRTSAIPNPTY